MFTFTAHLYGPSLPAAGMATQASLAGGRLNLISGEGQHRSVVAAQLEVSVGGYDGRQWLLAWDSPEGRFTLLLPAGALDSGLQEAMPSELVGQFERARRRHSRVGRRFRLAAVLLASLFLLPLLMLGVFWLNADRIAGWAAGHVSLEQEARLGEMAFAQMQAELKLLPGGPMPAMVEAVGNRLTAGSAYRYQWHVAIDPRLNAFAVPGGHVVVYTGLLLAADSAEEVAGVLAHEVQHVEMRHALKNLLHNLGWRALLALALGDFSGGVWTGMAEHLGQLGYSRDLEHQADLGGLAALRRAGIAPEGIASFFAKLSRQGGGQIDLLSTHPASSARMQALQRAMAAQGAYTASPLPYDWRALQASLPQAP
jgi:Zn-dependent protease with chaperone function